MDDVTFPPAAGRAPLVGTCNAFVPVPEANERTHSKFLSSCECGPLNRPLVKRYTRSAAGVSFEPHMLRPEPVLLDVSHYLLSTVVVDSTLSLEDSYGFVSDRLRSVRQDAAIQQLVSLPLARVLVASARYHVLVYRVATSNGSRSTQAAVPLGGSGDQGDSFNPVMNDSRLNECVAHGLGVCNELLRVSGEPVSSDNKAEMLSLHGELLSYQLALAFLDAPSAGAMLRTLVRTKREQLRHPMVQFVTSVMARWVAQDWHGVLRSIDALGEPRAIVALGTAADGYAATLLWCLLQRYAPLARLHLLRGLAEAFPARIALPLDVAIGLLRFRDGTASVDQSAEGLQSAAWEFAARFCLQLGQAVALQSEAEGGEQPAPVPVTAAMLAQLRGSAPAPRLLVTFDKKADLHPRSTDVKVRSALGPTREAPPAGVDLPTDGVALSRVLMAALL